jgi:hypothetical protein
LNVPFSIPVLLIGAVIAQGVFAALVLLFQGMNRKANRYLSLLVLAFSLWLCVRRQIYIVAVFNRIYRKTL